MKQVLFSTLFLVVFCFESLNTVSAQEAVSKRSSSVVTLGGQRYYVHTIAKGDTFYHLGKLYDTTEEQIRKDNPHVVEGLKLGQIVKIAHQTAGVTSTEPSTGVQSGPSDSTIGSNDVNSIQSRNSIDPNKRQVNPYALFPSRNRALQSTDMVAISDDSNSSLSETGMQTDLFSRRTTPVKDFDKSAPIEIAIMLPLKVGSTPNRQYLEFYQGALLALADLKSKGISANVSLYNTARSVSVVGDIIREGALDDADLIIGPVYDDCFGVVADYATRRGIPVVSPLAAIESIDNPLLFQVSPLSSMKNYKFRDDLSEDKNVILFSSASNDAEMVKDITPLLPNSVHRVIYSKAVTTAALESMLRTDKENVIVVLSSNENSVDEILSRISSIQNSLVSRSIKNPIIKVIGNAKWARFPNIDKNLFFKLNVRYVTSYHADRSDSRVEAFDGRYVSEFGTLPTLYSYRGYDVTKLFVDAIKSYGSNFTRHINNPESSLLQTRYIFAQRDSGRKFENREWAKVCYNNDYTITVQ